MLAYATQRDFFNSIVADYTSYLRLYAYFNMGSLRGATPFVAFYWSKAYLHRSSGLLQ